ncbi:hypothetical protein ACFLR5_01200 [Elusimicrobiota bacterium]
MYDKYFKVKLFCSVAVVFSLWGAAVYQPEEVKIKEIKEISNKEIIGTVAHFIKEKTRLDGGYFLMYDKAFKKVLMLELDKISKKENSIIHIDKYTDLVTTFFKSIDDQKEYQIDFIMSTANQGRNIFFAVPKAREISIRKGAGEERYVWIKKGKFWIKKKEK